MVTYAVCVDTAKHTTQIQSIQCDVTDAGSPVYLHLK